MSVRQFIGSIQRIARNPNINRVAAMGRHLDWQRRRLLNDFPADLRLSDSVLVATHGRCGVSALVNAHGLYDFNNMTLIKRLLAKGGVFIDVGANVGAYTLVASEQRRAQVLAFEPHPDTFALLLENLRRNARDNVSPVCAAVGDDEGDIRITHTPGSSTTHVAESGGLEVRLLRLDRELARRGLEPDVVKIDVEGFEFEVLCGLGEALAKAAAVFVEINGLSDARGRGREPIVALLRDAGFEGPWYYDARSGRCHATPVHRGEDPLFVNHARAENSSSLDLSAMRWSAD
jgi:FkbM family methyltransferase